MTTNPELEALREKLIEAVVEAIDKIFDKILMPAELEPAKQVQWGKTDPFEYGTPTTIRVDESVLVRRGAARLAGGAPMPLVVDKDGNVLDDGLDGWIDPQEGRFDRED